MYIPDFSRRLNSATSVLAQWEAPENCFIQHAGLHTPLKINGSTVSMMSSYLIYNDKEIPVYTASVFAAKGDIISGTGVAVYGLRKVSEE